MGVGERGEYVRTAANENNLKPRRGGEGGVGGSNKLETKRKKYLGKREVKSVSSRGLLYWEYSRSWGKPWLGLGTRSLGSSDAALGRLRCLSVLLRK